MNTTETLFFFCLQYTFIILFSITHVLHPLSRRRTHNTHKQKAHSNLVGKVGLLRDVAIVMATAQHMKMKQIYVNNDDGG